MFFIYLITVLGILTFWASVVAIYLAIKYLPLDYNIPKLPSKEAVNIDALQREFEKYFPRKKISEKQPSQVAKISLPKPLKIEGYATGFQDLVILRAGKNRLVLVRGEEEKGWKLLKIEGNKVYLKYRGKLVILEINKEVNRKQQAITTKLVHSHTYTISRQLVQRLTENYGQLLRQVDFTPYIVNGISRGFKIRWLSPSSIFYKIGFRTGDVILSVNDIPIRNTEDLFKVIQIIRNEPSLRVKILRNGQELILNINIE